MRRAAWKDREVRAKFFDLARDLGELGVWVRLHYVYPYPHVDEVIGLMAEGKILPYLDIPFQHASPEVLKAHERPGGAGKDAGAHQRLARASARTSPCARPSSSAFPARPMRISPICSTGSSEAEIDRVGCFKYEPVAGAAVECAWRRRAGRRSKQERWNALMARQQTISARRLKRKVGTRQQVIIDEVGPTVAKGRARPMRREIDGAVYVASRRPLRVGEIVTAKIERADAYDLHGSVAGF